MRLNLFSGIMLLTSVLVLTAWAAMVVSARQPATGVVKASPSPPLPADVRDRKKTLADDLYSEAFKLVDQGTPESFKAAESKFREARLLYSGLGNRRSEAYTLNEIVFVLMRMGKYDDALRYAGEALPMFRLLGEAKGEATALNHIGGIWLDRGEYSKALEHYERSLPLRRAATDVRGEGTTLNNIASIYFRIGQYQKALDNFTRAVPLRERARDAFGVAESVSNLGALNFFLGENQRALKFYRSALAIQDSANDIRGAAVTLNNIGSVHADLYEFETALICYEKALPLRLRSGDRGGEATTLLNIGQVNSALGKNENAWDHYRRALPIMREVGDRTGEAVVLSNIGVQYLEQGDIAEATDHFYQALFLSSETGDRRGEAKTLDNLMYASVITKNSDLAIFFGKQAVNTYQELRSNIGVLDEEVQSSFLRKAEDSYRTLVELLVEEGRIPEAEQVLRMLKDEEYFQFVSRDAGVSSSLDERISLDPAEKSAAEQLNAFLKKGPDAMALDSVGRSRELGKLLSASRKPAGVKGTGSADVPAGSRSILKEWRDGRTAVISTIAGEKNLTLIVTTAEFQRGYVIPVSEKRLNELVGNFRSAITKARFEESDPNPAAQKLYNVLIKPIEKDLQAVKARTLIWSLDKFLRYVPVSALWDREQGYVVQRYSSVVLALASRQNLAFRPANKGQWQALGVGMSKEAGGLSPLAHVPKEIQAIVRDPSSQPKNRDGLIAGRQMLDEQFTYDKFRGSLGKYAFTHAATHFVFISGTKAEGLNSYLLLGDGRKLTLQQVQKSDNMFAGIELLTLSACDTGYGGKTADGREIEGLGVLAQRKGARAIMATLWPVDDESTRHLMVEFYRGYQKPGVSKAEALRKAQLAVLGEADLAAGAPAARRAASPKRFPNPHHWSPFILIGNWR